MGRGSRSVLQDQVAAPFLKGKKLGRSSASSDDGKKRAVQGDAFSTWR